jgi:hypothetical protein
VPRATRVNNAPVTTPVRSPSAARAHASGQARWTIDLAQSPARVTQQAAHAANRSVVALGLVVVIVWGYDLVRIAGR